MKKILLYVCGLMLTYNVQSSEVSNDRGNDKCHRTAVVGNEYASWVGCTDPDMHSVIVNNGTLDDLDDAIEEDKEQTIAVLFSDMSQE